MRISYKKFFCLIAFILLLYLFFVHHHNKLLKNTYDKQDKPSSQPNNIPIIIWWTKILQKYDHVKDCGFFKCRFTVDRSLFHNPDVKAFAFYASDLKKDDFPLPRKKTHLWALYHEESPKNVPYIQHEKFLQHFNFTSTFSRYSDHSLTTQYIDNYLLLRTQKYLVPIGEKNKLQKVNKLSPIVYVQSICDTITGRDQYVSELMRYIEIDSYGKCLNNKDMPDSLSENYLQKLDSDEFYRFLARYKFVLAIENGVCNDYITEKFWRPLIVGSIPIYFGSPTIRDWMPNNKSAILISDFDSPKKLAEFIRQLDKNDHQYNEYLDHKYLQTKSIKNENLKSVLIEKGSDDGIAFEYFECFVCKKLHEKKIYEKISMAKQSHYDCNMTQPKMETKFKEKNYWDSILKNGKCEADLLNRFFMKNLNYTNEEFNDQMRIDIETDRCKL